MNLGIGEILVILVIALLIFGPSKLPQLGDALGKGIRNFKKATTDEEPPPPEPAKAPPAQLGQGAPVPPQGAPTGADASRRS